jgi:hypothetical protein
VQTTIGYTCRCPSSRNSRCRTIDQRPRNEDAVRHQTPSRGCCCDQPIEANGRVLPVSARLALSMQNTATVAADPTKQHRIRRSSLAGKRDPSEDIGAAGESRRLRGGDRDGYVEVDRAGGTPPGRGVGGRWGRGKQSRLSLTKRGQRAIFSHS